MVALLTVSISTGTPKCWPRQFQQHSPRFGGHPAHRPAIALDGVGSSRAALVRRDIRAAHDEAGLVVGDIQFVAHHLPERSARTLAAIGLADEERRSVVGMNHDPGVELQEVGIGIRAGSSCRCRGERVSAGQGADARG